MPQKPKLKNEQKPRLYLIGGVALGVVLALGAMLLFAFLMRPQVGQVYSNVVTFEADNSAAVTGQAAANATAAPRGTVIADRIQAAQLAPDGESLVTARTTGTETDITLHTLRVENNLSSNSRLLRRISDTRINELIFHPNGRHLVITTPVGLRVISTMDSNFGAEQRRDDGYQHAAYSSGGNYLAIAGSGNGIRLLDASNFDLLGSYITDAQIRGMAFNTQNQIALLTGSDDGTMLHIFDVQALINDETPQISYQVDRSAVFDMAFHPDGRWLVIAGYEGATAIDITTNERSAYPFEVERIHAVAFSDDGNWLVFGGGSSGTGEAFLQAMRWNQQNMIPPEPDYFTPIVFSGHEHIISDVAFSGNERLLSSGYDGSVRLWDVSSGAELSQMRL
jgi:WD40 repeat protein